MEPNEGRLERERTETESAVVVSTALILLGLFDGGKEQTSVPHSCRAHACVYPHLVQQGMQHASTSLI